jgi:hypothetical protein
MSAEIINFRRDAGPEAHRLKTAPKRRDEVDCERAKAAAHRRLLDAYFELTRAMPGDSPTNTSTKEVDGLAMLLHEVARYAKVTLR